MIPDDSETLFRQVCDLYKKGHTKGSDTPEETLNRLFRKRVGVEILYG